MRRFLLLTAGGFPLAIPLERVREVVPADRLSEPRPAPADPGRRSVSVRGRELPVVEYFAPPGTGSRPSEGLAVLEADGEGLTLGLFTDTIHGIQDEQRVALRPLPRLLHRLRPVVEGVVEDAADLYFLVDVAAMARQAR